MSLYEDVLASIDPKLPLKELTPEVYKTYHQRVTNKGLAALSPKFYEQVESDWSGYGVSFGMDNLVREAPDPLALVELIQAQELGLSWQNYQDILKDTFPDGVTSADRHALSLAAKTMQTVVDMKKLVAPQQVAKAPEAFTTFLSVKVDTEKKVTHYSVIVNYQKAKGPTIAQQCFETYYLEQKRASSVLEKQRAIVKCIRSLHVAHLFPDANGRLNILLLLNFFLLQAGFLPVILRDPAVFGGALTLDELLQELERGEGTFELAAKQESK